MNAMEALQFLLDFVLHIDRHLAVLVAQYGPWIYLILFLIVFCETGLVVTPVLPGDSLLFVAGTLAATGGMNAHALVATLIAAAVLGDSVNYTIGRRLGLSLMARFPRLLKQQYLDKTHAFYERHGGKTIILARFVPIVRTFAPFVAGAGAMSYRRFFAYNIIGGVLWVASFTYAGYLFGNLPVVKSNLEYLIFGIIFVSLLPGLVEIWRHKRLARKTA
ncbi:DedA family protein [Pseudogulbenkiania ferrooxidans]|uniref:SNARE associated Golgi protein n=1 Tax=Pseudogulbenkiania ferrooxidans 2002 TaxID=279714 RepID=B9Z6Y7_9NEIS|nr:DedA family protein [Pseudogulbenkiania ferrooxidans]EEG07302.1 SNARE associated Golgi protein [Pseudogulbenkiania ferrooxidans 2002]